MGVVVWWELEFGGSWSWVGVGVGWELDLALRNHSKLGYYYFIQLGMGGLLAPSFHVYLE